MMYGSACADKLEQDDENKEESAAVEGTSAEGAATGEVQPSPNDSNSNETDTDNNGKQQPKAPRERRERGPPADGIPSKNKVMVANLPYDLTEEKVSDSREHDSIVIGQDRVLTHRCSSRSSSPPTSLRLPRSPSARSLAS